MIQAKQNVKNLKPYTCARDLYNKGIFLDANESPIQWVKVDWSRIENLNRYPEASADTLRQKLVDSYVTDFSKENIFIGAGSDEIIDLIIRSYVGTGEDILVTNPSYSVYEVQANINDVGVKKISLNKDFSLDIRAIKESIEGVKLMFLCSPNNPTGNLITKKELLKIRKFFDGIIVVDEAYIEFAGMQNSLASVVDTLEDVVILRTFSKAWGLAGIRLGYAISSVAIVNNLLKIKDSYNVSKVSQDIVIQALDQVKNLDQVVKQVLDQKENLQRELQSIGFEIIPTSTNFILARIPGASDIYKKTCKKGVIIRDRSNLYLLNDVLRITVGTRTENKRLIDILKEIL